MYYEIATSLWLLVAYALLTVYVVWQLNSLRHWRNLTRRQARPPTEYGARAQVQSEVVGAAGEETPSVAVIVPFRNERANLARIAATLQQQDYAGPTELIFVDDHSTDQGGQTLPSGVRQLHLADYLDGRATVAHKKAAITYAVTETKAEIIITTDADCAWPPDRLRQIIRAFQRRGSVVLGPVLIDPVNDFCDAFQALDLVAYQFLTAAAVEKGRPILANGANFAFRRALFGRVNGYAGMDHLPSGDDVLLLHKFNDLIQPPTVKYAAAASVTTRPVAGWRALWRQRLRWAGKAGAYTAPGLLFAQALTFALSLMIVLTALALLWPFALHLRACAPYSVMGPRLLLLLWGGKALVDGVCLLAVTRHFGQSHLLRWYPAAAIVYPWLLVGIGTAALLGRKVDWKGRPT